jgi:hypothetical protein
MMSAAANVSNICQCRFATSECHPNGSGNLWE